MTSAILRTRVLSRFSCLGDRCEDTCCQGWSMQVDAPTLERYRKEAPDLLEAVESSPNAPGIMRKDPETGFCVKLQGGLCGIHKTHGDRMLGDACHFYPRITRSLGNRVMMTATMSCPEIVRLALSEDTPCAMEEAETDRLPDSLKNYLPDGMAASDALAIHQAFLKTAQDNEVSAERIFLRIASASRSLERIDRHHWPHIASFYLAHADQRLPHAEPAAADPFNLLHALCGLVVASRIKPPPRLRQTIEDIEKALEVTLDWQQAHILTGEGSLDASRRLQALWQSECATLYAPVLRRWLQMQLSMALYPYAGLGDTLTERITFIGVRLATIKLALMCGCGIYGVSLPQEEVVRTIQSVSRFLDHLGDAGFSLLVYAEAGWTREARMRGMLETEEGEKI